MSKFIEVVCCDEEIVLINVDAIVSIAQDTEADPEFDLGYHIITLTNGAFCVDMSMDELHKLLGEIK